MKQESKEKKKNGLDTFVDIVQIISGITLSIYGLFTNNTIIIGIGGLLILFCRRKIEISLPFKNKK